MGPGEVELVVRRIAACRKTRGRDHDIDPLCTAERARSPGLPEGRVDTIADTPCRRHRATASSSLDADRCLIVSAIAPVKMPSPGAYLSGDTGSVQRSSGATVRAERDGAEQARSQFRYRAR